MHTANEWETRFIRAKETLLNDKSICSENRKLFKEFYGFMETKLKRINGHEKLDEASYKTLYGYIKRLRNVNKWFGKPLKDITKEDIQRVYDDLEEGRIKTSNGKTFTSKKDYYSKVFKSKLFQMIGKDGLAKEVILYPTKRKQEVRYILEEDFRRLQEGVNNPIQKALLWLAYDIGENINSLLELKKKDFTRRINKDDHEPEYLVTLRKNILKRSRLERTEPTHYADTVRKLDVVLEELDEEDLVFPFGYNTAFKILRRAAKRTNVKCQPNNDELSWKDLRSGMASDLLNKNWTVEQINGRLGHRPSSREIDVYVSHFAINKAKPKRALTQTRIEDIQSQLEDERQRNKALNNRLNELEENMQKILAAIQKDVVVSAKERLKKKSS